MYFNYFHRFSFTNAVTIVSWYCGGRQKYFPAQLTATVVNVALEFLAHECLVLTPVCAPADYLGGWLCFWVSILVIGMLTGVVGDVASSFGCTVGLKDSVTAITFVALGTSLPGRCSCWSGVLVGWFVRWCSFRGACAFVQLCLRLRACSCLESGLNAVATHLLLHCNSVRLLHLFATPEWFSGSFDVSYPC